jgi:hypothetical protein
VPTAPVPPELVLVRIVVVFAAFGAAPERSEVSASA